MPSPRFCLQCGAALETRDQDGRSRPVCPACGWVYYAQHKVCVGAIVVQGSEVLLLRRTRPPYAGAWGIPAGYVEIDETPGQAAARETLEETGLAVAVGPMLGVYPFDDDPRGAGLLLAYLARPIAGELRASEEGEVRWTPLDALPEALVGAGQSAALLEWRQEARASGTEVRFCARCGTPTEMLERYGRPRPVCPACGLVHFREPKTTGGVIVEDNGRILLARRTQNPGRGLWNIPSGYTDWDERVDEAAVRELAEETGLQVEVTDLFGVFPFGDAQSGYGTMVLYRGRVIGGKLIAGDDTDDVGFFAPDSLPLIAFDSNVAALTQWLKERQG
ncbi:MAG: NUDIX domain-containing protein [Anaerolineae bacterium]